MLIGEAGDGMLRVGEGQEQFPVFAAEIQGADSAASLKTRLGDFREDLPEGPVIFKGGHLAHEAAVDIVGHLSADDNVGNAFAQRQALFGADGPPAFGPAEDAELGGLIHGHFNPQDIMFVVKLDGVLIHPVTDADAIVPGIGAGKGLRQETAKQWQPAGIDLRVEQVLGAGVAGDMQEFIVMQHKGDC